MSNVLIEKNKLDVLATAISNKSGEPLKLTLDEMVEAVDGIETGGGSAEPNLQTKSVTYTPNTIQQTDTVTADGGYDGLEEVDVTVNAVPMATVSNTDVSQILINGYDFDSSTGKFFSWSEVDDSIQPITQDGFISTGTNIAIYGSTAESEYQLTTRSSSDLTASGATVTVPSGYYSAQASKAVSSGTATPASTISGTSATVSTGTNTLTLSKTVSNTPQVSAGYISSGTAGNSSVSLTASVTTKGTATITPTTTNQTIASGTYLTGTQTISGDANLVAGNIKSGTSIFGVTGTYTGGGGSSDVAMGTLTVASNVNTSTSTQITNTTAIGFTPTKFFFYRSDRSATSNHVNQASFVTLGTSYYVRTMTRYSSNALSTSGNANNWTTQTAGYLYFNSNTIYFRSSSSYILPSGTWNWVAVK